MTDRNVWSHSGSLIVQRDFDYERSNLVETWFLNLSSKLVLDSEMNDPLVKVYISESNDVPDHAPPTGKRSVQDSMSFSEVPDEIQNHFVEQLYELMEVREYLFKYVEWGRSGNAPLAQIPEEYLRALEIITSVSIFGRDGVSDEDFEEAMSMMNEYNFKVYDEQAPP